MKRVCIASCESNADALSAAARVINSARAGERVTVENGLHDRFAVMLEHEREPDDVVHAMREAVR